MEILQNERIDEKLYTYVLDNGLKVIIVPKKTKKKYIIWAANYGSIDNKFYFNGEKELTILPDGIAHYLEHKLFEQKNGKNSLDVLTSLGVDANAYTTNDHTAFLYECTENFYEALDEFMDYVQNPYFTDQNIEKERGIIGQEIMMYDDYPDWRLYMNAMKALYNKNEINIDTAGTIETIKEIDKEKLYKIYNSFYVPQNMILVACGDFEPQNLIEEINKRMIMKKSNFESKKCYFEEPKEIVKSFIEEKMNVSLPLALLAYKDNNINVNVKEKIKNDLAISILGLIIFGKTSKLYSRLYDESKLLDSPSIEYEFSKTFAHIMIQYQSDDPVYVANEITKEIEIIKNNGIDEETFQRVKKKLYGDLIKDYNDVASIATFIVRDYFKGINSLDYLTEFDSVTKEYTEKVLNDIFVDEYKALSVIK